MRSMVPTAPITGWISHIYLTSFMPLVKKQKPIWVNRSVNTSYVIVMIHPNSSMAPPIQISLFWVIVSLNHQIQAPMSFVMSNSCVFHKKALHWAIEFIMHPHSFQQWKKCWPIHPSIISLPIFDQWMKMNHPRRMNRSSPLFECTAIPDLYKSAPTSYPEDTIYPYFLREENKPNTHPSPAIRRICREHIHRIKSFVDP